MESVRNIVKDFKAKLNKYVDDIAAIGDDDDALLLGRLDECSTRLVGVTSFIDEIESGTKKHCAKVLTTEAVDAAKSAAAEMTVILTEFGIDWTGYHAEFESRLSEAVNEFPTVSEDSLKSIERQFKELKRMIANCEKVMEGASCKKVVSLAKAIGTTARRLAKTQLQSGIYQPKKTTLNQLVGCWVDPTIDALVQHFPDDYRDRLVDAANRLLQLADPECGNMTNLFGCGGRRFDRRRLIRKRW